MDYNNDPQIQKILPVQGDRNVQPQELHNNVQCIRSIEYGKMKRVNISASSCVLYCPNQTTFPLVDYVIVSRNDSIASIIFKQVTTSTALYHIQRGDMKNKVGPDSKLPELEVLCNLKEWSVDVTSRIFNIFYIYFMYLFLSLSFFFLNSDCNISRARNDQSQTSVGFSRQEESSFTTLAENTQKCSLMTALGQLLLQDPTFESSFALNEQNGKFCGQITCESKILTVNVKVVYVTLTTREENMDLLENYQIDNFYLTTRNELPAIVKQM